VADRLGSIEKGKIANLVVTDGNLFDERTKITRVFVEGRSVALEAAAAPAVADGAAADDDGRPSHDTHTRSRVIRFAVFWAAWGGWALDGMDSFIYSLVLAPALTELLPNRASPRRPATSGTTAASCFALFLIGWGLSMMWGPIADRFGRVRTLMATIVCYSLFTFLCGLVTNIWQLAAFRLLAGIGIGGEWSMGGTFVAEEWPEDRRKTGSGYMHTGYTSASSSPRSPTTSSAPATAGGGCSWSEARRAAGHLHSLRRPRVGRVGAARARRQTASA
jgi:hypothetical protein